MSSIRDRIVADVARACTVRPVDLLGPTRGKKPVAEARQIAMWVLYHVNGLNAAAAGRVFERDQSTARFAIDKVNETPRLEKIGREVLKNYNSELLANKYHRKVA